MTHTEGKIHRGHENVHRHHDQHHPGHRERTVVLKPGDGIDVSEYQGSVDWKKADTQKPWLAMAKITEGASYTDKMWSAERAREMEATHARCAVYHFARPGTNKPEAEVANVLRVAEKAGLEWVGSHWYDGKAKVNGWRLFLDWETPPFTPSWLAGFGAEWERHVKHLPDLYGGGFSLNPCVSALDHFHAIDFAAYVADWKPYAAAEVQAKTKFWQHSSTGSWPGVNGSVDLDRYLG